MKSNYKSQLILEDGRVFQGFGFGKKCAASGEVVFTTAMTGYTESLTDPSYRGQILTLTYPIAGIYGVPPDTVKDSLPVFFESGRIQASALIVSSYSLEYNHWNAVRSLDDWLCACGVPAVCGIDTRALTKHIRQCGTMLGKVVPCGCEAPASFDNPSLRNLAAEASCSAPAVYGNGKYRIVLVDCGSKHNIIRCLAARNAAVVCVPWDYDFTQMDYDGLMLSNGPGNPQMCAPTIANLRKAFIKGKPIFGICLGHQLLSIAAGASTFKLKYGHRSHNQPVQMAGMTRAFITSQNHGYAVDTAALPPEWQPYCTNLNDNTNEGIIHASKPFFSVQFHPEASGGPTDTEFLFDTFMENVKKAAL